MPTRIAPYKNDPNRLSKKKHNRNTKEPEIKIKCQNLHLQSKIAKFYKNQLLTENPVPIKRNPADLQVVALRKYTRKF